MKIHAQILLILIFGCLSIEGVHAGGTKAEKLSDAQMAEIHGGMFCPLEICEDPPGTGVCRPIPPNQAALCKGVKCKYEEVSIGPVVSYGCVLLGADTTCTGFGTYRQCVWAFRASVCSYSTVPACGQLVNADCLPDRVSRQCNCAMVIPGDPCEWTNCLP